MHQAQRCGTSAWVRALASGGIALAVLLAVVPAARADGEDTTPPEPFDIVADAGQFQTGWEVASPYTSVWVTWHSTVDDSSAVHYELRVDGVAVRIVSDDDADVLSRRIEVADGRHTVTVVALDAAGNETSADHALDVVVDTVSPVFTSRPRLLLRTGPVTEAAYPMRYTWSGTDEGTGLALGRIGSNSSCCYPVDPTLGRYDFTVRPGSSVAWRIWLYDGVGRLARSGRDGYVTPVDWSLTRRSPGWSLTAVPGALDGSEWVSAERGQRFRATAQGRSVAWVATSGPRRGHATVLVDGKAVASVDLHAPRRGEPQVVWTTRISRSEPTRITVVNRSTGRPSKVGVDAFLLQR